MASLPVLVMAHLGQAQSLQGDPIGDVLLGLPNETSPRSATYQMKASLYHAGARGVGTLDSLGCRVVAMRTAAIDAQVIPKRTVLFSRRPLACPCPTAAYTMAIGTPPIPGGE